MRLKRVDLPTLGRPTIATIGFIILIFYITLSADYADYLSVYYLFRQDLQDLQDFFAFPACPAPSGEERQKPISLFEGVHWAYDDPKLFRYKSTGPNLEYL